MPGLVRCILLLASLWLAGAALAQDGGAGTAAKIRGLQDVGEPVLRDLDRLERLRDAAQQAYDAGRIGATERDRFVDQAERGIEELYRTASQAQLDSATRAASDRLDALESRAAAGDPADIPAISAELQAILQVERQNQFFGRDTGLMQKVAQLFERFYKAMLANCASRPVTPVTLLGIERQAELLGITVDHAAFEACLPKVYVPTNVTYKSRDSGAMTLEGIVNDPMQPFSFTGKPPGSTGATYRYTPTGESGGTSQHEWAGPGFTGGGSGRYSMVRQGDDYVVTDRAHGCAVRNIPKTCNDYVITITLSPRSALAEAVGAAGR
jgi:hypothetical protein